MKRIIFSIICALIVSLSAYAQDDYEAFGDDVESFGESNPEENIRDFLGIMLLPGSNTLVRFYELHQNHDGSFKYTQLTMDAFMFRAAGKEKSVANPSKTNFFQTYGISDPNIVSQLWKLRYKQYPYETIGQPEPGWANNSESEEMPSNEQFAILSQYGITRLQDVCYGHNLFMLIKDIANPQWIMKYKSTGSTSPIAEGPVDENGETYIDADE